MKYVYSKIEKLLSNNICFVITMIFCLLAIYPMACFYCFFGQTQKLIFRLSIIAILFIVYLFRIIKYKTIDFFVAIMSLYCLFQVVSTFINHEYIVAAIYQNFLISISGLLCLLIYSNINHKLFVKTIIIYLLIATIINLAINTTLEGFFFDPWLMGRRTNFIIYFLPLIIFNYIYDIDVNNKFLNIKTVIIFILVYTTIFLDFSSTLFCIITICFIVGLLVIKYNKSPINIYVCLALYVIIFLLFVLPGTKGVLTKYVCVVLGKNAMANDRLPIYDKYINLILHRDMIRNLIGGGFLTPEGYRAISKTYVYAHNIILQIMTDFGIMGIAFFIFNLVFFTKFTNMQNGKIKQIVQLFFAMILLRSIYDSYCYWDFMFLMGLLYNSVGYVTIGFDKKFYLDTKIFEYCKG